MENHRRDLKGRGSQINPPNRFDRTHVIDDFEQLEYDEDFQAELRRLPTVYLDDDSKTVVSENDSPDIPFRYSLNPYRGCLHGCAYCYARPYHEYLGLNAGLDFESKIYVKHRAADLFREFLNRSKWQAEPITFSGVTDCYQPAERQFRLTRQCLEVALEARQPLGMITKNALVARDLDLLREMAQLRLVHVNISLTTLDAELARTMEPRTSSPTARLKAMSVLSEVGVPVNVMVAPVIPGLNDSEVPAILKAASESGAQSAGTVLLRLPLTVRPVFQEWLERTQPLKKDRVEGLIRSCRDGELNSSVFGERMRGSGPIAEQIQQTFRIFRKKYGLEGPLPAYNCEDFRPPRLRGGQLRLF
ncbi:PA0069 family radical SAM protein [Planctomicrobium piriforme]|uniref:DNA repair photolyase n=1 Tax=Planctomicrobium piriforme TaxID=1576369 RepID=A0A1I3AV12_9PLAN|nr:PA0069 family radical SAM protein [Planctomicrobium piriforme]SFH53853.1 DNA repair photolyase [Planctomicrobium piriforme]